MLCGVTYHTVERKKERKEGRKNGGEARIEYLCFPQGQGLNHSEVKCNANRSRQTHTQTDRQTHISDNLMSLPYRLPHTDVSYI